MSKRDDERALWTKMAGVLEAKAQTPERKYHNKTIVVDGHCFDSKKECARYQELKFAQAAGKITDLELQPIFPLQAVKLYGQRTGGVIDVVTIGQFAADFRYVDLGLFAIGEIVTEDVKSEATRTTAYLLRKTMVEKTYGMVIREV